MDKRRRCSVSETRHRDKQNGNKTAANDVTNPLMMSNLMMVTEIKQEPNVKAEPQPVGDLETVSPDSHNNPAADQLENNIDGEVCQSFPLDVIKIEFKEENENEKKEKDPGDSNGANEDEVVGQSRHPLNDDHLYEPMLGRNGTRRNNIKKAKKVSAKGRGKEQHRCPQCEYTTKDKWNLKRHLRKHTGEKPFQCKQCFKRFTQKHHLQKHIKMHSGPRSFRCSNCFDKFAMEDEKNAHEQKCNRRTYKCNVCGKSFGSQKGYFDQHMRIHTGEKPFECNQCQKKFTQIGDLQRHRKIHSRFLPWKCSICQQGFSKEGQCKAHQRSCTRRVYECFDCKKFIGSNIVNLKRHMLVHSGEKAFKCEICQKQFTLKGNLRRHLNAVHK